MLTPFPACLPGTRLEGFEPPTCGLEGRCHRYRLIPSDPVYSQKRCCFRWFSGLGRYEAVRGGKRFLSRDGGKVVATATTPTSRFLREQDAE